MICDVSSILKITGASVRVSGRVRGPGRASSDAGLVFHDDIRLEGVITNIGSTLELKANVTGSFQALCARCVKELTRQFDIDFTEILANRSADNAGRDAVVLFEGNTVDVSDIAQDNILVNLPSKYLCDENCKGLCPVCGADLNVASCDCESERVDPRMAGLKKLLEPV
jgi:uncharacterized protein